MVALYRVRNTTLTFAFVLALMTVTVQAAAPPSYVRTDGTPKSASRSMVFDNAHGHIFAAVSERSRLEVFSSSTHTRVATIEVPDPTSVDISPDGSRIAVGTVTQYIYLIDTSSLQIADRVAFRPGDGPVYPHYAPTDVVYLSNGKALVRADDRSSTTGVIVFEWDLATNTFTKNQSLTGGFMTRSANYSKVLTGGQDSGGAISVYDASTDTTTQTGYFSSYNYIGAANPDGSQFAVSVWMPGAWSRVVFLDTNLNEIGYVDNTNAWGMVYSADGRFLYISHNYDPPSVITVVDTQTFKVVGQISDAKIGDGFGRTHIQGIDNTNTLFGGSNQGVTFINAGSYQMLAPPYPDFTFPAVVAPPTGSASGNTLVTISGTNLSAASVSFGGRTATVRSTTTSSIVASTPSSSVKGPVDLTLSFSNGWTLLAPEAFSYGPHIHAMLQTAGSAQGGQSLEILGYGFGVSDPLTVTIGGASATVQRRYDSASTTLNYYGDYHFPLPLQAIVVTTPPGVPGLADVTITTPSGSTTLKKGFEYLSKSTNFIKSSQLRNPTYDVFRDRVYLSNGGQVEVFDLSSQTWLTPVLPPSGAGSDLRGMVVTPDGAQLLVTDFAAKALHVINLADRSGYSIDLSTFCGNSYSPGEVVWANGRAYVATVSGGGSGGGVLVEVDIATENAKQVSYGGLFPCGDPHPAASGDGSRLYIAFGNCSAGDMVQFDFTSGQVLNSAINTYFNDAAASADGNTFATGGGTAGMCSTVPIIVDTDLRVSSRPYRQPYHLVGFGLAPGQTLHPSGALLYEASPQSVSGGATQDYIDVLDTRRGDIRRRVIVSGDLLLSGWNRILTADDKGKRLFAVTRTGLAVYEFSVMPLAVGGVYPSVIAVNSNVQLKVRGSGFKSGAKVNLAGQTVSATFIDDNTLTITSPSLANGKYSISVTNPDGDSYSLPLAVQVMAPRLAPVIASVSPNSLITRGSFPELVVMGTNFYPDSTIRWRGANRPTTFVSTTELRAQMAAADLDQAGLVPVTVFTPLLGGGTSNAVSVSVLNPVPKIIYAPTHILVGSQGFTMNVFGDGVLPVSVARWNGKDLSSTYSDYYKMLEVEVTTEMLAASGTVNLTLFNPAPGGGESDPFTIVVGPPAPAVNYPAEIDFGQVLSGTRRTQSAWLYNSGQAALTALQATIDSPDFSFYPYPCLGYGIAAGDGCGFTVMFAPKSPGRKTGTLTITDNMENSPHLIPLKGEAIVLAPQVSLGSESDLTDVSATLRATVMSNMTPGTFWFEWSKDGSFSSSSSSTPSAFEGSESAASFSQKLSGLTPATTYYYRAVTDSALGRTLSSVGNFRTPAPDFDIGAAATQVTVIAGQSATYQLALAGSAAFEGDVTITCSGAPTGATCSASPATVHLTRTTLVPTTLTVATTARRTASAGSRPAGFLALAAVSFGVFGFLSLRGIRKGRVSKFSAIALYCIFAVLVLACACGGGGGSQPGVPITPPPTTWTPTPTGSYPLTVTATSAAAAHPKTLTVWISVN